ncbi:MAG: beta-ketoacyl-[acyl-carrier-protein] synthase family protein [Thermoanaerobaculia bacterium]
MNRRRVVVTGLGLVTPLGVGTAPTWQGLLAGRIATGPVRSFDAGPYRVDRGAEITGFCPEHHLQRVPAESIGRASQFAAAAARMAVADAGLDDVPSPAMAERSGVAMGTTSGEPAEIERFDDAWIAGRSAESDPRFVQRYPFHVIAQNVAAEVGFRGPVRMLPNACAAGNYAVAQATELLRSGAVDRMLAGGADIFSRITYSGFARLGAVAPDRCRPFDRERRGMIPGEGAGVLLLETLEAARARGAHIYAEVAGYGLSCDAHHMTGAHPTGDGAVRAMERALSSAGAVPGDVSYVSAHGTGTQANDRVEAIAIQRLFGARAAATPVSSIKSMIGHTMGAASAIEAAVCALAVRDGWIPPTANFVAADDDCHLDFVPNVARRLPVKLAMNNAYAFGGSNASVLFRAVDA